MRISKDILGYIRIHEVICIYMSNLVMRKIKSILHQKEIYSKYFGLMQFDEYGILIYQLVFFYIRLHKILFHKTIVICYIHF